MWNEILDEIVTQVLAGKGLREVIGQAREVRNGRKYKVLEGADKFYKKE